LPDSYVALMRGLNVGRANRVDMAGLRTLVKDLGFANVRTRLNSGNVIFDAAANETAALADRIEAALAARLKVSSRVIVLTAAELTAAVNENPLIEVAGDASRLLVYFRQDPAGLRYLLPLLQRDWSPEAFALGTRAAYAWCPAGVIESRLVAAAAQTLGAADTTTRNWATVMKLHALVNAAPH
jgi:uncharacterized protein (DUF1697 family)